MGLTSEGPTGFCTGAGFGAAGQGRGGRDLESCSLARRRASATCVFCSTSCVLGSWPYALGSCSLGSRSGPLAVCRQAPCCPRHPQHSTSRLPRAPTVCKTRTHSTTMTTTQSTHCARGLAQGFKNVASVHPSLPRRNHHGPCYKGCRCRDLA